MIEVYLVEGYKGVVVGPLHDGELAWPVAAYTINAIAQNHAILAQKSNKACLEAIKHNLPSNSRVNSFDRRAEASCEPVKYRVRLLCLSFDLDVMRTHHGCPLVYPMGGPLQITEEKE